MRSLALAFLIALLAACGTQSATPAASPQPTIAPAAVVATAAPSPEATIAAAPTDAPTAEVLAQLATDAPTAELATEEIAPTDEPTAESEATSAPAAAPAPGAAPQGSDCPADHPVKGNIRDRNPNKGEKIYHLPGDNGYAQTKPERCFVDSTEAEAAGYRPVKK